jgi:6-phosphogluconolactonase
MVAIGLHYLIMMVNKIGMNLHIYKTPHELSLALAEWITDTIEITLKKSNRFTWALTGGNSPKELYELLSSSPLKDRINWKKLHIFWGDERAVPFSDDRNNAKMTFEHLLNKVPIVKEQVHIMNTALEPAEAAADYEKILRTYFSNQGSTFDLVLNGMGDDGHTLSLFPHTEVIHEKTAWVKSYWLEQQNMYRITLTAPLVNRAKKIAFLTFGDGKAKALAAVLQGSRNMDSFPSQIIQPTNGELNWFTDMAAAKFLV